MEKNNDQWAHVVFGISQTLSLSSLEAKFCPYYIHKVDISNKNIELLTRIWHPMKNSVFLLIVTPSCRNSLINRIKVAFAREKFPYNIMRQTVTCEKDLSCCNTPQKFSFMPFLTFCSEDKKNYSFLHSSSQRHKNFMSSTLHLLQRN